MVYNAPVPTGFKSFLERWAISTLAVLITSYLCSHVHWKEPKDLVIAALFLGILNSLFRPLKLLTMILTLGVMTLVLNAFILLFVSYVMGQRFHVDGFMWAMWSGFLISFISLV